MFKKNKLSKLNTIFEKNSTNYNIRKTIEELQELSLILTQQMNKPKKDLSSKVIEEIAHVQIRMVYLNSVYCNSKIKKQINKKIKQIYKNVNNR